MLRDRKKMRMTRFDYSSEAFYFVTSCVKDRYHHFGEVVNQQMILNEYGKIAHNQWTWLYNQYSYIKSHAFVVMPNHIHGVIEIIHPEGNGRDRSQSGDSQSGDSQSTKIKSLSELMGVNKTTSSKQIHLAGLKSFLWQKSFYDNIIRDEQAFINIVNYIENNPKNWKEDKFY
jgi:putative transposase